MLYNQYVSDRERAEKFWEINLARDNSVVTGGYMLFFFDDLHCSIFSYVFRFPCVSFVYVLFFLASAPQTYLWVS